MSTSNKYRMQYAKTGNPSFRRWQDYKPTERDNMESWRKVDEFLTEHDGVATLMQLVIAIGRHPRKGGARKFVLYCADNKWLRIVTPLK